MGSHPDVLDLVERCLDALEQVGPAAVDELLQRHPQHAAAVRLRLQALAAAQLLTAADAEGMPERLGDFRLLEVIGRGGMGVVYRAEQTSLGRQVALKVIRPEHLFFPEARVRFRREVESVARLDHPGIVPVYLVGEDGGVPYFAMEFVEGVTLEQILADVRARGDEPTQGSRMRACVAALLPGDAGDGVTFAGSWVEACLALAAQVADALDHAHRRGVLHRDVKPSNVMVTRHGRARLLDFGLARIEETHALTRSGSQLGSLPYMAPEQVRGARDAVDVRTDVYGVGVTLYELLALRPAFAADTGDALRQLILSGERAPLRQVRRGVPRDVETVCGKAMDPDPARRYQTAADLGDDLRRILARKPIGARPPSAALHVRRWAQRHPAQATAAVLGALLVLGTVAYAVDARAVNSRLSSTVHEEQAQRRRAQQNLDDAIAAIDGIVSEGSGSESGEGPVGDPARKRLLERALHLYEQLLEREREHEELAWRVVHARWRIGRLRLELGQAQQAREVLEAAVGQSRRLVERHADRAAAGILAIDIALDLIRAQIETGAIAAAAELAGGIADSMDEEATPGHRARLAQACHQLAMARYQAGDVAGGLEAAGRAAALYEALLQRRPDDIATIVSLASALQMLGYWTGFHRPGQPFDPLFQRAVSLQTRAVELSGGAAERRINLGKILSAWAHVCVQREQWQEAICLVREAQASLAGLTRDYPMRVPYAEAWLANQYQLGWLLHRTGERGAAERELREGVDRGAAVAAAHPDHTGVAYRLAMLSSELARCLGPARAAEADVLWESAHRTWEAVGAAPPNPTYDQQFGTFFDNWARFARACGRAERALALVEQACAHHRRSMARYPHNDLHRTHLGRSLVLSAELYAARDPASAVSALQSAVDEAAAARADLESGELRAALGGRADYEQLIERVRGERR